MSDIIEFPREWYRFATIVFRLRSSSLVSPRPWAGGNSVYGPHAQLWMPKLTAAQLDGDDWQGRSALFDFLGGQAGLLRMSDPFRTQPLYNRQRMATQQAFTDGTRYTDGTGNIDGMLPPAGYLTAAASRGDVNVTIGGLLPNLTPALNRGDLLEFRPNGIADATPRLHVVVVPGNTDSQGRCGVQIRAPLRAGLAAGDMAVLVWPSSVFHLTDDDQGEIEISRPYVGNYAFNLIEAVENI